VSNDRSDHDGEIVRVRREKLAALREAGNAFPNDFRPDARAADLQQRYATADKAMLAAQPLHVRVAGRVMLKRVMGKASFLTLQDGSGRIQIYLRRDLLGEEEYDEFESFCDIGDIVGVEGPLFRTNKGELTVEAEALRILTKSLRPLPEKFHGLTDQEARYRQRYLDLLMNEDTRRVFRIRSEVVQALREFFVARGFVEVETPMMQVIPGGAMARPFVTHHNALDMDLYLRVAPELYLKRLVVGGFDRVFEINRNFRNEGLSTKHNPEFTMLEFYEAYRDFHDLMDLTEEMLRTVATKVLGTTTVVYQGETLDFGKPIPRLTVIEAIEAHTPHKRDDLTDATRLREILRTAGVTPMNDWGMGRMQFEVFEALVEDRLVHPVFVTEHPAEVSPLARRSEHDPEVTDRFELFVTGREIANGFSELNDPEDQAERFRRQMERKDLGDHEAMHYDHDYVTALEYGMPPTAGEGVGVDRLVMLLSDTTSIRDVLLFPHLKPREPRA